MIRVSVLALAFGLVLGCGSREREGPAAPEVPLGESFELAIGEGAVVAGSDFGVWFDRVLADSRCPRDVTCVWAGDAAVRLRVRKGGNELEPAELHTHLEPSGVVRDGYSIMLTALDPYPVSTDSIAGDAYRVRLKVFLVVDEL